MSVAAEALIELGAAGVFTADEGEALTKEFIGLVRTRSIPSVRALQWVPHGGDEKRRPRYESTQAG